MLSDLVLVSCVIVSMVLVAMALVTIFAPLVGASVYVLLMGALWVCVLRRWAKRRNRLDGWIRFK